MKLFKATECDIHTRFLVHNADGRRTIFLFFAAPLRSSKDIHTNEGPEVGRWTVDRGRPPLPYKIIYAFIHTFTKVSKAMLLRERGGDRGS